MSGETPPPAQPAPIDALLPPEIARKAEEVGVAKAGMDATRLFTLAVLAGAFIGLGAMAATTMWTGLETIMPFGLARMLGGLVFALGLILVVLGGAELFTGNNLMVMAVASRRIGLRALLRAWSIVFVGNLVGSVGTALLVFLAGHHLLADGAVGVKAFAIGAAKVDLPLVRAFFMGVLCNVLVCLAVWLCYGAHSTTDKLLAILFPITAFVAAGFEHSVANMYLIPQAMMIQNWAPEIAGGSGPVLTLGGLLANLIPVTVGNVIGGGVLVGLVYWFVYLRPRRT
jgi:formate transporter